MTEKLRRFPWMGLLGLALLVWLWKGLSWSNLEHALQLVGAAVVPLSLLGLLWLPWDALCMATLLARPRPWLRLFLLEWASEALSRLIPSAGLGGEPFRYRHLKRWGPEPGRGVVVYRVHHAVSGLFSVSMPALVCWWQGWSPRVPWLMLALGTWLAGMVGLVLLLRWMPQRPGALLRGLGCKLISRFFQVAELAFLLMLMGQPLTVYTLLVCQAYLAASTCLFAFVPGGYGVQEGALIGACEDLGLGRSVGLELGFLRRCRQMGFAALGLMALTWLEADAKSSPAPREPNAPVDAPGDRPDWE